MTLATARAGLGCAVEPAAPDPLCLAAASAANYFGNCGDDNQRRLATGSGQLPGLGTRVG